MELHAGLVGSCGVLSLRSSSSFLAVMRMRVSWMVQLPLRYSRAREEEEEGGAAAAAPWMSGTGWWWWWWRGWRWGSGKSGGCGNGVVEGSDMVLIWHEIEVESDGVKK